MSHLNQHACTTLRGAERIARFTCLLAPWALLIGCSTQPPAAPSATSPGRPTLLEATAQIDQAAKAAALMYPAPAGMTVTGVPPIERALADQFRRYEGFRGHEFMEWHPIKPEMLVLHRRDLNGPAQLHLISSPLDEPRMLAQVKYAVKHASWEPVEGGYIVVQCALTAKGDRSEFVRLDPSTSELALIERIDPAAQFGGWLKGEGMILLVPSGPLVDESGAVGRTTEVWVVDPVRPLKRRQIGTLAGSGWSIDSVAADRSSLIATRTTAGEPNQSARVMRLDIAKGKLRPLVLGSRKPSAEAHESTDTSEVRLDRSSNSLWFVARDSDERRTVQQYDLASNRTRLIGKLPAFDALSLSLGADGRYLAARFNVEGRDEVRLIDTASRKPLNLPMPVPGAIRSASMHPKLGLVALTVDGRLGAPSLWAADVDKGTLDAWTRPAAGPGLPDPMALPEQTIIRWRSFDQREITGVLTMPTSRWSGPRPVLVAMLGGVQSQARVGALGRLNSVVEDLGFALIQPNLRGASGYGRVFMDLDNGPKRTDVIRDLRSLLDWIASEPALDARRVFVAGGGYGGYLSLSAAVELSEHIAGVVSLSGYTSLMAPAEAADPSRRDAWRRELGDERDAQLKALLDRMSPLTGAEKIRRPLLITQGGAEVHRRNTDKTVSLTAKNSVCSISRF